MCCQLERETERYLSLKDQTKRTRTLAEQYSRFIPEQVGLFQLPVRNADHYRLSDVFKSGPTLN